MKPDGVVKRLERLSFEALPEWDGTYKIRINRSISGLPAEIAHGLTVALNLAVTKVRLRIREETKPPEQLTLLEDTDASAVVGRIHEALVGGLAAARNNLGNTGVCGRPDGGDRADLPGVVA